MERRRGRRIASLPHESKLHRVLYPDVSETGAPYLPYRFQPSSFKDLRFAQRPRDDIPVLWGMGNRPQPAVLGTLADLLNLWRSSLLRSAVAKACGREHPRRSL